MRVPGAIQLLDTQVPLKPEPNHNLHVLLTTVNFFYKYVASGLCNEWVLCFKIYLP